MIDEKILKRRKQRLKWYHKNKEQEKIKMVRWRQLNPEKMKEYREKDKILHIIKVRTQRKFNKDGSCSFCNEKKQPTEFHHWVYNLNPKKRDISELCIPCHKLIHRTMRRFRKSQIGQT